MQRIDLANQQYLKNRYHKAREILNLVIAEHPRTEGVGAAYYLRGMCYYRQGRDDLARSDFEWVHKVGPNEELVTKANAQLGHISYQRNQHRSASKYYAAAIAVDPKAPFMDQVYYRYGDSLQKLGHWESARTILPKTWNLFPESELTSHARRKFSWNHDYYSIQCGAFSRSDRAYLLAGELRRKGFSAYSAVNLRGQRAKHVVRIGKYGTFTQAESDLARVRRIAEAEDAFIVP